ncbi:glycoside hydrolase family 2 protein [Flavicella sediminum]|uniref:glycoside hydrolase family 2 protein n=1 Tax=Flavicella sediminum TaxID=2585141 RepID=UPI0011246AB7|nr:glycoside hydrolase family 2 TIM barrel-domain containing protein [Flavicella sediminum]
MSVKRILESLFCFLVAINFCFGQETKGLVEKTNIDADWLYLEKDTNILPKEKDAAYQKINLPHTWNALDVLVQKEYRKASSWYRKYVSFTKEDLLKRNYIRFGAAGQEARVYLNGKEIKHHVGGYSAFICEMTADLKIGQNQIDVWVDNKKNKELAPLSADYNFYGGLYRAVELITAPKLSFAKNHVASSGVRVWSDEVASKKATIHITALVDNGGDTSSKTKIVVKVMSPTGKTVGKHTEKLKVEAGDTVPVEIVLPKITNPTLWSPEHPNLYTVELELYENKKLVDKLLIKHGFKWFEFTANNGFFLNGKPYTLKGINRHQDYFKEGNAVSLDRHLTDIKLIKELGVNWLRLAHYQQDDYVLDLCDSLGILVWEEIPYVNNSYDTPKFEANLRSMMKDLINQHFNHSSIILWGMGNEVWMGDRGDGKAKNYDMLFRLNNFIHEQDPVRKTVFVNGDNNRPIELKIIDIPDVFGYNLYRGWYGPDYNTLTERLNEIHEKAPKRPIILSEFGAGSDIRIHSENPKKQDFSIEYQNDYIFSHLKQVEKLKWLSGVNYWSFADFGAAHRGDSKPHINQKGLVTFDRKKKDAFYLVKSLWTKDPVLYIESPFLKERSGKSEKTYRIFSNMEKVELFHNGKSLGKKKRDFNWKVNLVEGKNTLLAKGILGEVKKEHGFTLLYQKNRPDYKISASLSMPGFPIENGIDKDPKSRWSAAKESSVKIDLDKISLVNGLILFPYQTAKIKSYAIEIKGSIDGVKWESLWQGDTNKRSIRETILFSKQAEIRYVKIDVHGNNIDKTSSFYEIEPIISLEKQELNLYEKIGAGKD